MATKNSQNKSRKISGRLRPVSLREVATAAGCSLAAVSLALRNSPRVSEERRRRIQALAREMGYRPNPLAAAFHAEIRKRFGIEYRATLGWINDSPDPGRWKNAKLYEAARGRAEELGYVLDMIHVDPTGLMDAPGELEKKILRVVRARGVYGVVLPELYRPALAAEEWAEVAVVCVGDYVRSLDYTRVARVRGGVHHMVAADAAANLLLAARQMEALSLKRIGLAITQWWDWRNDHAALGRYLVWSGGLPSKERIPPFVFASVSCEATRERFVRWLKRHCVEAVMCCNREILEWATSEGIRVPAELRVVHLEASQEEPHWSGVEEQPERLGRTAIEVLAAMLQRNERGVPPWPRKVLVPGVWRQGETG